MRIRRRPRMDALNNEVRKSSGSWGRWLYLGVIATFALWLTDLFIGDMLYFHTEGLVVRDRVVLATQYDASVEEVKVVEGGIVNKSAPVIALRSQSVEESIAELSADLADLLSEITQLRMRQRVIASIGQAVDERAAVAQAARRQADSIANRGLFTTSARARLIDEELQALTKRSQNYAESRAIREELPKLESALATAQHALERLTQTYADGQLLAPTSGVVGYLNVAPGSVVRTGEPLLEMFEGTPYVLAYVPEGAIYELLVGDTIDINVGFHGYHGRITELYPVTATLPKEFQDEFKREQRARIARIDFTETNDYPTLFARTELSTGSWPPAWMKRWFKDASTLPKNQVQADSALSSADTPAEIAPAVEQQSQNLVDASKQQMSANIADRPGTVFGGLVNPVVDEWLQQFLSAGSTPAATPKQNVTAEGLRGSTGTLGSIERTPVQDSDSKMEVNAKPARASVAQAQLKVPTQSRECEKMQVIEKARGRVVFLTTRTQLSQSDSVTDVFRQCLAAAGA